MNCLWCDKEIFIESMWRLFLKPKPLKKLCDQCFNLLEIIAGNRCRKCSRKTAKDLCSDCKQWGETDPLCFNYSIFTYNDFMKEIIAKWKFRGDYILGQCFEMIFLQTFQKFFVRLHENAMIIPIPLSEKRMAERGFNQAEMLARFLSDEVYQPFIRVIDEKQSKKTKLERMKGKNPFILTESIQQPVILVDDIYTTGTTLRHAARLLKQNGCPQIYSYTLVRG